MDIHIALLHEQDAKGLFEFESQNRRFFEEMVPSRGDDYYEYSYFGDRLNELLQEQKEGLSYFFLIKDEYENIVGRMNVVDIYTSNDCKIGHVGYRIGEQYVGKGVATNALKLVINKVVEEYKVNEFFAKTTIENVASQKVLEKSGFCFTYMDGNPITFTHYHWKNK